MITKRCGFVIYFFFQKWTYINLGVHLDLLSPNIEIHIPFGFFRIGWECVHVGGTIKTYGWDVDGWCFGRRDP